MLFRWFFILLSFFCLLGCSEEENISIQLDQSIGLTTPSLKLDSENIQISLPAKSEIVFVARHFTSSQNSFISRIEENLTQFTTSVENNDLLEHLGLFKGNKSDEFLAIGFAPLSPDFKSYHIGAYCKTTNMNIKGVQTSLQQRAQKLNYSLSNRFPWLILTNHESSHILAFAPTGDHALQCYAINAKSSNEIVENTFTQDDTAWLQHLLTPATQTNKTALLLGVRNAPRYLNLCLPKEMRFREVFLKGETIFAHLQETEENYFLKVEITAKSRQEAQQLFEGLIFLRMKLTQHYQQDSQLAHLASLIHQIRLNLEETTIKLETEITAEDLNTLLEIATKTL